MKIKKVSSQKAMRNMKKGMGLWCLIVILAVLGSVLSGMAGAANMSANLTDNAINTTEQTNNVTSATISNSNETVQDNASSIYNVSVEDDFDGDGISDYDELHGITPYNLTNGTVKDNTTYFTNPMRPSTDEDPYDDYIEITGKTEPVVIYPGRHPCVPAYADLKVAFEGIEVIPKCKITSTETKEEGDSWLLTTETLDWTRTDWGIGGSFSLNPLSWFVGIKGYRSSEHESYTYTLNSTSGWSREEWSVATAVDSDKAAKLKFHVKIKNDGTDAAKDVKLTFNVKIGDKLVDTVWTDVVKYRIEPGEESKEMVIPSSGEEKEIVISLEELKSIECGAPISIEITETDAMVPWKEDYIKWEDYIGNINPVSSTIMADFGDGVVKEYKVWSGIFKPAEPPHIYFHDITINDAIDRTLGIKEIEDEVYIGWKADKEVKLENWTFGFDNETFQQINETLRENWTLYDLLNVTIKQGWVIVMKAPDIKPPEIHWTSYSRDMKTIKAGVSDNENITEVIAHVKVGDAYENVTLADKDGDLVFNAMLPEETIDTEDDYIVASDGKFTTKGKILKPSVTIYVDDDFEDSPANHTWNTIYKGIRDAEDGDTVIVYDGTYDDDIVTNKSITVILKGESNNRSIKAKGAIIGGDATLIVNNAIYIVSALYDYQYNLSIKDSGTLILDNGSISTSTETILLTRINYSIYFGNISKYVNYTFYEKEVASTSTEKALSDYSKIENVQAYANRTLQKYTGFDISKAENISTNVTIAQSHIQSYYKIKLNLSDNATFATKNDSKAVIYKINITGQPEINISESVFDYLTAINGKADVIIATSYMGDLEKLSANSVDIFDSQIKNIGDDAHNYGDPGEDVSLSIDCVEDVYISNSTLLAEGGDGYDGSEGLYEHGGDGGNGGNATISITCNKNITIDNSSSFSSIGGNAGDGGNGDYGILGGLDGGDGGDGGYASVSITSDDISIRNSNLSSKGGNRGSKGHSGGIWPGSDGSDGYLGDSSISFASKTLTTLDSNLQSTDYNGDSKISYMTFDCYTNLVNTTYTPFSVTSGNRVNICYWLTTNVTDEVGKPIENAKVKVTEDPSGMEVKTDYTDKNGISKMFLPSNITTSDSEHIAFVGNYFVQAFKNGYESDKESISFTDNLQINLTIEISQPTVSISTDKYKYSPGDTMNIIIHLENPTETAQQVIFAWYLILPDYDYWQKIMFTKITLPQGFDESFSMPLRIKYWSPIEFNATWHVVLLDKTTYEIISEDDADWKYVPTKEIAQDEGEVMPEVEEIAEEIEAIKGSKFIFKELPLDEINTGLKILYGVKIYG